MNTVVIIITILCGDPVQTVYYDLDTNQAISDTLENTLIRANKNPTKTFKVIKLPAPQIGMCV